MAIVATVLASVSFSLVVRVTVFLVSESASPTLCCTICVSSVTQLTLLWIIFQVRTACVNSAIVMWIRERANWRRERRKKIPAQTSMQNIQMGTCFAKCVHIWINRTTLKTIARNKQIRKRMHTPHQRIKLLLFFFQFYFVVVAVFAVQFWRSCSFIHFLFWCLHLHRHLVWQTATTNKWTIEKYASSQ